MRILFAGNKERGALCLKALIDKRHAIVGVVLPQKEHCGSSVGSLINLCEKFQLKILHTNDPNSSSFLEAASKLGAELCILAGYGKIVEEKFLGLARHGSINLHAGKLPDYRGSSPMNWALLNGESEFGLSIIQVDRGVDTGPILSQRTFPILPTDHFIHLECIANLNFPEMLTDVVEKIEQGTITPITQDLTKGRYFPLRFPGDGLILWDQVTSMQAHNRIRGLSPPAPGAFTFYDEKKILLLQSEIPKVEFTGEPGRIYQIKENRCLVGTTDRSVWVSLSETDSKMIQRYGTFSTVGGVFLKSLSNHGELKGLH